MEFVHKLNICPLKLYKKLGKTLNTNYGLDTITYEDLKKNITTDESWHKYMLLKNLKGEMMKIGRGYIIPEIIIDECAFLNVVKVLYKVRKGSKYKTLRRNKYIKRGLYEC